MFRKVFIRKSGRGKTLKLIQECYYRNREDKGNYTYILVADMKRAMQIRNFARKKGYDIPFPITAPEIIIGKLHGSFIRHLLVDDADDILEQHIRNISNGRVDIAMMTFTKDDRIFTKE